MATAVPVSTEVGDSGPFGEHWPWPPGWTSLASGDSACYGVLVCSRDALSTDWANITPPTSAAKAVRRRVARLPGSWMWFRARRNRGRWGHGNWGNRAMATPLTSWWNQGGTWATRAGWFSAQRWVKTNRWRASPWRKASSSRWIPSNSTPSASRRPRVVWSCRRCFTSGLRRLVVGVVAGHGLARVGTWEVVGRRNSGG